MTKDTLLAEAAEIILDNAAYIDDDDVREHHRNIARRLRAREDAGKADALDAAAIRKEFRHWFVTNAFDLKSEPIGGRQYAEQWSAYAAAKGLTDVQRLQVVIDENGIALNLDAALSTKPEAGEGEGR